MNGLPVGACETGCGADAEFPLRRTSRTLGVATGYAWLQLCAACHRRVFVETVIEATT